MAKTNVEISACRITGCRHSRLAQECEDVVLYENRQPFCFCGIADGKSGASSCIEGAQAALQAARDYIRSKGIQAMSTYPFSDEFPAELMHAIRSRILEQPGRHRFEDYASTLLAAAIDCESGCGVMIHLGDGCAVGIPYDGRAILLSKPENRMDARFTWLTTSQDAAYHVRCSFFRTDHLKRIVLMTDGASFLCNGKIIPAQSSALLEEGSIEQIRKILADSRPRDDASCLLLQIS